MRGLGDKLSREIVRAWGVHCRQDDCAPSDYFKLLMFAGLAKIESASGRLYSIDS
jgi:hypothetical protein